MKTYKLKFYFLLILFGCANNQIHFIKNDPLENTYKIKNIFIHPGKIKLIGLPYKKGVISSLNCNGNIVPLYKSENKFKGYLAESYF